MTNKLPFHTPEGLKEISLTHLVLPDSNVDRYFNDPEYPDPTPEMLNNDPLFDAIWKAIRGWDISRHNDGIYCDSNGNDARHIYDAIKNAGLEINAQTQSKPTGS